jgi:hypothetical protein
MHARAARLPADERRGHHLGESVTKPVPPTGRVDPIYAGHHGRHTIHQDTHTQMITMRASRVTQPRRSANELTLPY